MENYEEKKCSKNSSSLSPFLVIILDKLITLYKVRAYSQWLEIIEPQHKKIIETLTHHINYPAANSQSYHPTNVGDCRSFT